MLLRVSLRKEANKNGATPESLLIYFNVASLSHFRCKDRIRIFQNLDRPEVNEDSLWDDEICGNISNLPQKKFYSKGRGLILEFHTDSDSRESHIGFKGVYTFLEKSKYCWICVGMMNIHG